MKTPTSIGVFIKKTSKFLACLQNFDKLADGINYQPLPPRIIVKPQ